jgi:pSer/pThr/pTyr-binding forkhead associated (FHA) protein
MGVRFVICSAEGQPPSEEIAYGFEQARIVIGRGAGADVRIPHLTVSDTHATVRFEADAYAILDNDSTNGTQVNGVRVVSGRAKRLHDGDRIDIGAYALTFHEGPVLSHHTTIERTAELARRLFRQSQHGSRLGAPRLCVLSGPELGKSLDLPPPPGRALVGRDPSCQLVLPDPEVAPEHVELRRDLDGVLIASLDAKSALDINGQLVQQRRLRDGDELVLGTTRLLFEEPAEEPIDGLATEADLKLLAPLPSERVEALPQIAQAPSAPQRTRKARRSAWDTDLLIYTLAAIVIALSVAGLIALMRGG